MDRICESVAASLVPRVNVDRLPRYPKLVRRKLDVRRHRPAEAKVAQDCIQKDVHGACVEDEGADIAATQPGLLHPALDGRVVGVGEREQAVKLVLRHPYTLLLRLLILLRTHRDVATVRIDNPRRCTFGI